ncbi:SirB2 family protein [Nitrosovibrio sp. Nv17]|jgi:uncharacterized membrane protein SirB2|uniref:SirB2 family protein n=1 Tax=Nitrosovibrio sp. Nv17 TaxID=1855339 RepID=UPI0009085ECC|nr:SirB2 family protein [Nitrosovibrio sp. Nv17]SFW36419.1 Uncharacterized membrane protein SirB2 [Nitrosovibrio sp. Nv17]
MSYAALKMIHVFSVALSYLLFFLRGIWMAQGSAMLRRRWTRITPHVVDTVLLTSAIALAVTLGQDPIHSAWLGAKVTGLLFYIGLGMMALRFGGTRRARIAYWISAQCVFLYIVLVALTKNPMVLS